MQKAKWCIQFNISSLFVRYVADLQTFGDENCKHVINCLFQLSALISISGPKDNWCILLALLIDYIRATLAKVSERPIPSVLIPLIKDLKYTPTYEFAEYLNDHYKTDKFQHFIIMFVLALFKSFRSIDLHKDSVAMNLLNEFINVSKVTLNPIITDLIIKTVSLVNLTADDEGRAAASSVLYQIISNIKYKVGESTMSLTAMNPQIVPCTRKVIGYFVSNKGFTVKQENFPLVQLYNIGAMETQPIIDMMWDYIVEKVNQQ